MAREWSPLFINGTEMRKLFIMMQKEDVCVEIKMQEEAIALQLYKETAGKSRKITPEE